MHCLNAVLNKLDLPIMPDQEQSIMMIRAMSDRLYEMGYICIIYRGARDGHAELIDEQGNALTGSHGYDYTTTISIEVI